MEVITARTALLSNFEVLTLLKDLEADQLARTKTALRIKKEEDERIAAAALSKGKGKEKEVVSSLSSQPILDEVTENLRTVEFEAIQYLTADYQPTAKQSEPAITKLVKKLAQYDLTKAEKLQIVNLAPTQAVELYVIVEEIEDRMGDGMDEILVLVQESLASISTTATNLDDEPINLLYPGQTQDTQWDEGADEDAIGEDEYDDTGEGAGIEGDLEMNDD